MSEFAVRPSFASIANGNRLWGAQQTSLEKVKSEDMRVVFDLIYLFLAQKVPITAWGPVGVGKTQKTRDLAYELDENETPYQVITIAPSTEDPTAFHGIVYTSLDQDGTTIMRRSMPEIVKHVLDYARSDYEIYDLTKNETLHVSTYLNEMPSPEHLAADEFEIRKQTKVGGLTILFMDEMTTCMPAQQHALLGLLTHAEYGGIDIDSYIAIMMAANPPGTVSTVNDLGEQVMNRGGHVAWYGDRQLWLDGWSTGFGRAEREPDPFSIALVEEVLEDPLAQSEAFRHEDWTPDTLVPFDRVQHTPRVMDQFGQVSAFTKNLFDDLGVDSAITDYYIERIARALMGPAWEARVSHALARLKERVSPEAVINRVRSDENLHLLMRADDFALIVAQGLSNDCNLAPDGTELRTDARVAILNDLLKRIRRKGGFSKDAYTAAWVFALSTGNIGVISGFQAQMLELLELSRIGVASGALTEQEAVPKFLSEEVRSLLRSRQQN